MKRIVRGAVLAACAMAVCVVVPAVAGAQSYNLYFGDLHSHTRYSDGRGTPAQAFTQARLSGADFLAVTDHDHYPKMTVKEWNQLRAAAASCTTDDFVAIAAFETSRLQFTHFNTFAVDDFAEFTAAIPHTRTASLDVYYDQLSLRPASIGQFNHPQWWKGGDFQDFAGWTPEADAHMCLLEVVNWYDPPQEPSYVKALDAGWHVMPTANSDTHATDWIAGWEIRSVLLAPRLTQADLFDAMRANRGYATADRDLRVMYEVDGAVMGSVLSPAPSYGATISVTDPDVDVEADAVTKLEIVSDGGAVVASADVSGHDVSWSPTLASDTARYFYLRVTTGDGVTAWTAPVWTGR